MKVLRIRFCAVAEEAREMAEFFTRGLDYRSAISAAARGFTAPLRASF